MRAQGSVGHGFETYLIEGRQLGFKLSGSELPRFADG